MEPRQEKNIIVDGIETNYKIVGAGPAILILHGWGSKSDRWMQVAQLLAQQNFCVVIPDLPGFGKSDTPSISWSTEDYCNFVEQFVQKTGLQNFYLLGHSFGGGIATIYAAKFPSRVKKLVLFASAVFRRKTARKTILRIIASVFKPFSFFPPYGFFRKAFYKFIVRKSDYPYTSGIMRETYKKVIDNNLSQYLSSIQTPTLVIWGDKDDVIPVADAYLIQQKIKNSQLVIIPGGDHDIEQHMPEVLATHIVNFCYSKK